MGQARDAGVRSLAFSLLSGGYFRGSQPLSKVLEIGVEAIAHGACKHDTFRTYTVSPSLTQRHRAVQIRASRKCTW